MKLNDIPDEKVRQIAMTLKSSGLAMSEGEAIRMAMNMSNTTKRVNDNFEKKKDWATMGVSHLKKDQPKKEEQPTPAPAYREPPKSEFRPVEEVPDLAPGDEVVQQPLVSEPKPAPIVPHHEVHTDSSFKDMKVSDVVKPQEEEEEQLVEKTIELPGSDRRAPNKDNPALKAPKVDLSNMFNFGKK